MYGDWTDIAATLSSWVLFIAAVVLGVTFTIEFTMKALDR